MKRISFLIFVSMAATANAQAPKQFDVAAIKLNTDGGEQWSVRTPPGGRFTARNITVRTLLDALGIRDFQDWRTRQSGWIQRACDIEKGGILPGKLRRQNSSDDAQSVNVRIGRISTTGEGGAVCCLAGKNGATLHPNTGTPGHSTDWGRSDINTMNVDAAELADVLAGDYIRSFEFYGHRGIVWFQAAWTLRDEGSRGIPSSLHTGSIRPSWRRRGVRRSDCDRSCGRAVR